MTACKDAPEMEINIASQVLAHLRKAGPTTVPVMSAELGFENSKSVATAVRMLKQRKLVQSSKASADSRAPIIFATMQGFAHVGPVRKQSASPPLIAVRRVRSTDLEEGGIVACALRSGPSFVFDLGGMAHA